MNKRIWIWGIDPSLTATAIAGDEAVVVIGSPALKKKKDQEAVRRTARDRLIRYATQSADVIESLQIERGIQGHDELNIAFIEQYAFSFGKGTAHRIPMIESAWTLRMALIKENALVVEVPIGTLKKFALGKGVGSKEQMLLKIAKSFAQRDFETNDEADALALYWFGCAVLGMPTDATVKLRADQKETIAKFRKTPEWLFFLKTIRKFQST